MHGYKMKNIRPWNAGNHAGWRSKMGQIRGGRSVKGASARAVGQVLARRGGLWQPAFYDRALRRDENRIAAARYIVANPLRAGLVAHLGDYPHWDSVWL